MFEEGTEQSEGVFSRLEKNQRFDVRSYFESNGLGGLGVHCVAITIVFFAFTLIVRAQGSGPWCNLR